ncbi:MAG TPA: site-specific integrase [Desulfatiglandales bacterium]|nr:site-specific integrase [Desulfatiglandales bacterium]
MAILEQCPTCHMKQATKNKLCVKCGEDMDKAKRSKKVKYWIHYRLPGGKQKWELIGNSIEAARDEQNERRKQKRRNEIIPNSKITFKELSEWYLDIEEVKGKASYRQMGYRVKLLDKEIGDRLVTHILPVDLQNYREKRKKKGLAPATIDDEITQAKMIVKKAWENKKVSANTLHTFLSIKNLLKSNANARDEIYTKEQFDKLINHKHCSQYLKGILATAFYTGMRKGEILNLTRDKVDLNNRRIKLEAIDTKTGEPRTCPICNELYHVLKKIPRALHDPHVFLYNGKPIKGIKTTFKTLCEKAKVPYGRKVKGGLTFHDLRHSFNTYMRKAGVDKEVIKAITGHSTDSMFTRYNKIDRDDIDQAVEKLEVFLNGN